MAGTQDTIRTAAFAALALIAMASQSLADEVKVIAITDGDTVRVIDSGKGEIRVRLDGIDAPERKQPFSDKSKQALSEKVFGKTVELEDKGKDRYGRTIGILMVDGRNINREMVAEGWAWWYRKYAPGNTELEQAETAAREKRLGLWADPMPVPPWDFRAKK